MRIISTQHHVSIPILMEKIKKEREHRIAVNLLTPTVGICVDGHHSYVASMSTHRPLRIIVAGMNISNNLTGAGLLDFWMGKQDAFHKTEEEWQFYDLMTGGKISVADLKRWVDQYPDYVYSV